MSQSSAPLTLEQASLEELNDIIQELEAYRDRLVHDTLSMAKRAKVMKTQAMTALEPQLAQIDTQLNALRQQRANLADSN